MKKLIRNKELRRKILQTSFEAGACHIASALSCINILISIFNKMKKGDIFLYGKVSGVCAFYVLLAEKGIIPEHKIVYYLKKYPLPHKSIPGVVHGIGSLGHGLPVAVGLALADRTRNVWLLMSDGEIQEGTTWESILFAGHHKLRNLKVFVDRNGFQALGKTEEIVKIEKGLSLLKKLFPIKVVKTIKGEGVDFMTGDYSWHYRNLTAELLEKALCQI